MSVVAVHAGTGRMVADDDPGAARQALATIEDDDALGVVGDAADARHAAQLGRGGPGALTPAPGLGGSRCVGRRRGQVGVTVEVRVEGDRATFRPGWDLAAYRIVQEALTNVIKHAGRVRGDRRGALLG